MKNEYIPENNLVILFLLLVLSAGFYYFWWLARISKIFEDKPITNVLLIFLTCGVWLLYINLKYLHRSEQINGRDMHWYLALFALILPITLFIPPLIIQHNINERYFPSL